MDGERTDERLAPGPTSGRVVRGNAGQNSANPGLGTKEDCAETSAVDETPA
jgi:hypothetical protein